jgi:phytoene dehydrogenase-like protein
MPTERADVVVVGGGICGLAAAALVARPGRRVVLLEATKSVGGRARTTCYAGYHLNLGPRALYRGPGWQVLRRLGIRPAGGAPAMRQGFAFVGSDLCPGFMSVSGLLTSRLLTRRERIALAVLLGFARPKAQLARESVGDWLERSLPTERSREAALSLVRVATYLGRPEEMSADALAEHLAHARRGVCYIDGGWQSIVDSLHTVAERRGVRVHTGARVTGVDVDGVICAHLASGEEVTACAGILTGLTPLHVEKLLGLPPQFGSHTPVRTACLDVALARLPDPSRLFVYGVGIDHPVYLSVHSASARLAPPGGAVVHLARYDDGTPAEPRRHRAQLEALLDVVQPGWRSLAIHVRYLPKMVTMAAVPSPQSGGLSGRPGSTLPNHEGLFMAGDWVGPRGLLADASLTSAARAAVLADAHLTTRRPKFTERLR